MKKSKSKSGPVKLLILLTLTSISVKAIGLLRSEEDQLATQWGMPLERHLALLGETGKLDEKHLPWSDFDWSSERGSLGNRWTQTLNDPLKYRVITLPELQKLSPEARRERVKSASPAEKIDIARLQFNFPLLNRIRGELHALKPGQTTNLELGWAIASTHLLEPRDTIVKVKVPHAHDPRQWLDLEVPFGSSDVKGLLAYYFGVHAIDRVKRYQVGAECTGASPRTMACAGIDPASFHILLANMIGKLGRSFVLDIDPGTRTVHRPVVSFESDVRFMPEGHYRVTTKVDVARLRAPEWNPYDFYNLDSEPLFFEYTLEVNTRGEIVRGKWLSEHHPEFAWRSDLPSVEKEFRVLADQIYQPVKKTRDLSAIQNFFR